MKQVKETQKPFVAYYRVSTKKQGADMAAQKTAVKNYLKNYWPPAKSFTETESGAKSDRQELQKALAYCKAHKGTLIVAKLDRLSRDLEFIGWIQKTDIPFVCCDMPQATRETIGFMGVMARWEREQIAKRTKEALAEKRKAGVKLGSHNPKVQAGLEKFRAKQALETAHKKAEKKRLKKIAKEQKKANKAGIKANNYKPVSHTQRELADKVVWPTIRLLRGQGLSFEKIALALSKDGLLQTREGGKWSQTQVIRIYRRNTR